MPYCRTHSVRRGPAPRAVVLRRAHATRRGGVDPVPLPAAALSVHAGAPGVGERRTAGPPAVVAASPTPRGGPGPGRSGGASSAHRLDADDAFLLGDALLGGTGHRARRPPAHRGSSPGRLDEPVGRRARRRTRPSRPRSERIPVFARAGSVLPLDDGWADPDGPVPARRVTGARRRVVGVGPGARPRPAAARLALLGRRGRRAAEGVCVDDAGDGDGPVRRDVCACRGGTPGRDGALDVGALGRLLVARGGAGGAARARARSAPWPTGSRSRCRGTSSSAPPFTELTMEGLRPRRAACRRRA